MGGFGSGRISGRSVVEESLALDLNRLLRDRNFRPGDRVTGSLIGRCPRTGKTYALGYEASLIDRENAWALLQHTVDGALRIYRVKLEVTPCHYGGWRWWWICPVSGQRVAKLYLPPGGTFFAARSALELAYSSQRESPGERLKRKHSWLHWKLGDEDNCYDDSLLPRPKGMHRKTYELLKAELRSVSADRQKLFIEGAYAVHAHGQGWPPAEIKERVLALIRTQSGR